MTPLEINKRVAEMKGWKAGDTCDGYGGELPNSSDGWFCGECGYVGYWGEDGPHEKELPNYAEVIGNAWELFEEMPPYLNLSKSSAFGWTIVPQPDEENEVLARLTIVAETAPLAICLAWLKWRESKS